MGIRPAKCYRTVKRPNTRQSKRKPRLSYVKGVPDPKIHRYEMGNKKREFPIKMALVSNSAVQIRHNALEAVRIAANKVLEKGMGPDNYHFKLFPFPHHVMRENPLATGAGADRFQTGMRKSFGKPIGLAAQIRPNQKIMEVKFVKGKESVAKKALKTASYKLPATYKIVSTN